MKIIPSLPLNDGHRIPQIGLGVWQVPAGDTARVVGTAFELGYRHVDGAAAYGNEEGIGHAIQASSVAREELFITTKLRNPDQGYDSALRALDASLARMGLDRVDLYLIHWPCPRHDRFVDSWKALVQARADGKVRSIGVSNFRAQDIDRIIDATGVVPAVNQIELHPLLQQAGLQQQARAQGIVTQAWSPLAHGGELLAHPVLQTIAGKHGRTVAQVVLRWHMQSGRVAIPKSVTPARMAENATVFDFALDEDDMAQIGRIDAGRRLGPDPADFEDMS
ncbi:MULTISPECIES: aldo/keto reductase [Stenotrophomonas]|uniref:Oxidoreductase n=1 Tax=Stenotrophomonas nitritireducens TaxID=83617 RepID=A0ABR5NMZ1_9GAMM|nr:MULTISPECIES: aldo/keto reductase [Stenotrophomonas]KQN97356.1 oxidoreductase [Stenotrophomonas sp. Leaf70]KRG59362.1 oxidoreductase [Stenotrophomonas nitritireducens]